VAHALRSLLRYYDEDPKWAVSMVALSKETPSLRGKSQEKQLLWEAALAEALAPRLPKSTTRRLTAQVIVGAAMAAFVYGVDAWAESKPRGELRHYLDSAFAAAKAL
jgi:hypothetical protein